MERLETDWERRLNIAEGKVQALAAMRRFLEEARAFECPLAALDWLVNELEAAQAERHFFSRRLGRQDSWL